MRQNEFPEFNNDAVHELYAIADTCNNAKAADEIRIWINRYVSEVQVSNLITEELLSDKEIYEKILRKAASQDLGNALIKNGIVQRRTIPEGKEILNTYRVFVIHPVSKLK